MQNIGIGLIGRGSMGVYVAKMLVAVDDRLQIRGLFDPDERSLRKAHDLAKGTAKIYQDYQELLAAPDIDWVMIASWNCDHKEQVIAAFEAGKDMFCQKPLTTNLNDCIAMYQAWQKNKKNVSHRFYAPMF